MSSYDPEVRSVSVRRVGERRHTVAIAYLSTHLEIDAEFEALLAYLVKTAGKKRADGRRNFRMGKPTHFHYAKHNHPITS
jgi:hypothetical protein